MLIDLLNSYNYLMVNMSAIHIFGLNTAVYCAELLNIYKKAYMKKKLIDGVYFEVDRKFIREQTSLVEEDQAACDLNLKKIKIIDFYNEDPNIIKFDFELFASLITSEDMKKIKKISDSVKIETPRGTKITQKEIILSKLKESIQNDNDKLNEALKEWLETIYTKQGWASKKSIEVFQQTLYNYTQGDLNKALKIVEIATVNGFRDCQWAINDYEKAFGKPNTQVRTTQQKVATKDSIGGKAY